MILQTVRRSVENASLWKIMIIDVFGSLLEYEILRHLQTTCLKTIEI